jgi:c-di-GMP-binding flagellar brake protein YcgR
MGRPSDRRRGARYKIEAGMVARSAGNRSRVIRGRIVDLSQGGVSAVIAAELAMGEVFEIEFGLPYASQPVRIEAAICNREGYRYGLEFVHVIASQQDMINRTCVTLALLR